MYPGIFTWTQKLPVNYKYNKEHSYRYWNWLSTEDRSHCGLVVSTAAYCYNGRGPWFKLWATMGVKSFLFANQMNGILSCARFCPELLEKWLFSIRFEQIRPISIHGKNEHFFRLSGGFFAEWWTGPSSTGGTLAVVTHDSCVCVYLNRFRVKCTCLS
jgi:hypothetical protein